ncbi:adenylate/guanylate cyclase domain-containing protein [Ramlibacter sp. PS3R-8]|uniref:adenylate/guanylate cyclase domain-containing protein n=1 Tax=Ramlibacter sp. PS3R-8 TaxID=3133437 RepID=UPI00309DA5DA
MSSNTTVMFADLSGSTSVFEALGNDAATQAVRSLTDWVGRTCEQHEGRVIKYMGDGVLALFARAGDAMDAVVLMQRHHARRKEQRGPIHQMQLQVGLASGDVVEVSGDCFGDAVNVAARLSDLAGHAEILVTDTVVRQLPGPPPGVRFHDMGLVPIRGKSSEQRVFRIEWHEDTSTEMMTLPASAAPMTGLRRKPTAEGSLMLRYLDLAHEFSADDMPVHLGRAREAEFPVQDPRVSRLHARIDWRGNGFTLVDLSSNGTCVRFSGASTEVRLRRDECVLHASGEIALAADFGDFTTPTVMFELKTK